MDKSKKELKRVWLAEKIFSWNPHRAGGVVLENSKWKRAYLLWEHAQNLILSNENDFTLADGISNLKRSLNNRLQLMEEIFHFKKLQFKNKPKHTLELLESLGIIRPLILNQLLEIRNDIEHNNASPPSFKRCLELVDVVWYFLKSTDSWVQEVQTTHIEYYLYDADDLATQYIFELFLDEENINNAHIAGLFPHEYVSFELKENFIEILVQRLYKEKNGDFRDKTIPDFYVRGKINFNYDNFGMIFSKFFTYL